MATTIDHLRVDHRITVLRDFADAKGTLMRAGDTGVLTKIDWDQIRMAMGANSTPAQLRALKLWMGGLSLLGVAGIVLGTLLIRAGQPNWAAIAAFAPTVLFGIMLSVSPLS